MLKPVGDPVILDHDTLPARFVIAGDGMTLYVSSAKALFLPAADVVALADEVHSFYAGKVTASGTVPA